MAVVLFYNPDLVGQLAACGIGGRRPPNPGAPTSDLPRALGGGFVLEGRREAPRSREAVTNVIAVRNGVTITGPRQESLRGAFRESTGRPTPRALPATTSGEPQTALELVEECARLRRDNQRLADEVARLREEVARLTGARTPHDNQQDLDDTATRFALLELD